MTEAIASENLASPSTCALYSPTSTCQAQASAVLPTLTPGPTVIEAPTHCSVVWAKALEIAIKKLNDNNLPPLDLTNLTSQSAEENIETVVKALNILQEDDNKKRWSYTWHGKEVIVVERLGHILKGIEKYSKTVDIAMQCNPQVSALVWAGVWAILRVRFY